MNIAQKGIWQQASFGKSGKCISACALGNFDNQNVPEMAKQRTKGKNLGKKIY